MVGAYLRQAVKARLDETTFWCSTPFNVGLRLSELNRRDGETALAAGWWAERFAREERLSSLGHYLKPSDPADADDGDALIASLASMHGLQVEDVSEEG